MKFAWLAWLLAGSIGGHMWRSASIGPVADGSAAPATPDAADPTFVADVAPILRRRCVPCHQPSGAAPFSLTTIDEVRRRATLIDDVVQRRLMPPWKPEPGYGQFIGERRLDDGEIDTMRRWIAAGMPEGSGTPHDPNGGVSDNQPAGKPLGTPDMIARLPKYSLEADGPDRFRNFAVRLPISDTRYVRAVQFTPGSRAVHHANIRIDRTDASHRLDTEDPEPGYEGLILHSAEYPDGHFLGWTPGQTPVDESEFAWRLDPQSDLVVQLHLKPTGKPETLEPSIALFFAERPGARVPVIVRLGRQTIDIPAGEKQHTVRDEYVLPVDVVVRGIQPHAHYRARTLRVTAERPSGGADDLLWIRDWDFDWQDVYRYKEPVRLRAGTRLVMQYDFDNSDDNPANPFRPARRAHWGWLSTDEMADVWLQVVTDNLSDRTVLVADSLRKMFVEDTAGRESLIERNPTHVSLRNDLGLLYMSLGRPSDALRHFQVVARLEPQSATAIANQALALEAAGHVAEAKEQFKDALRFDVAHSTAHNGLGNILLSEGRSEEALAHYRRAVETAPANAEARNNLGGLLVAVSTDLAEAMAQLREALRLRPSFPEAHYNLARAFTRARRPTDAIASYRSALSYRPDWSVCLVNLAWLLAAHPDVAIRQPLEAVRLAERAVSLTGRRDPSALDALAAAYAAAGRFVEAVQAASDAAGQLERHGWNDKKAEAVARLNLYRKGLAFVFPD